MNESNEMKYRVKRYVLRIRRIHGVSEKIVLSSIICSIFLIITLIFQGSRVVFHPKDSLPRATFTKKNTVIQINQYNTTAKGYIVWNPSCSIPDIDPYHDSIKKFVFQWKPIACSESKPLTSVAYNSVSQRHTLKIDSQAISGYSSSITKLVCCYSIITRQYLKEMQASDDDDRYTLGEEICFSKENLLPIGTEYIYVTCSTNEEVVYQTVHFMVANKKPSKSSDIGVKRKKFSILLLGIDSMSRLNFIRKFPKTREYIEKRGWLPLKGYTKIADNTFPNWIAVLTGMSVEQLTKTCIPSWDNKFDDCPFIWKHFSERGYLTAFSEDAIGIATFNIAKYGFLNSPTDYYSRPAMKVAEMYLPHKIDLPDGSFCFGQRPQVEYLFDFNTEFLQRFHDRPYFNLFWSNSFSHNELNFPSVMDERYRSFLQGVEEYLNSTVVIFFSDHGLREGEFRNTFTGWLEDRMPFIYFYLPPSLRAIQPQWYRNLRANKNKLVSTFDLHATLKQLLYDRNTQPPQCPKCVSLLSRVPHNRSCADAAIAPHWCPCSVASKSTSVTDTRHVEKMARLATASINRFIEKSTGLVRNGYRCANLVFSHIVGARMKYSDSSKQSQATFVVVFETKPSEAVFEITRMRNAKDDIRVDDISRINRYGSQSACVRHDALLKVFCFCVKDVNQTFPN